MRYAIAGACAVGEVGGDRAYPSFLLRDENRGVIRSTALGLTKPEVPNALRILFLWFHPY
jgi:hypothetical protein